MGLDLYKPLADRGFTFDRKVAEQPAVLRIEPVTGRHHLPVFSLGHIAGSTDAEPQGGERCEVTPEEGKSADFVIRIHGSSMEPMFVNDDLVGLKRTHEARPGQLVLARIGADELTFKRLGQKTARGVALEPLNQQYKAVVKKDVTVFGVYVWMKRGSKTGK